MKYVVQLSRTERQQLEQLVRTGSAPARKINRAHILLKADRGEHARAAPLSDRQISAALDTSVTTVLRVRRNYCRKGLPAAIERAPTTRVYEKTLDGRGEARLLALACSEAPEGRTRWTIRLLADKMVELGYAEEVSRETVRRTLKKTNCSLTERKHG